VIHISKETSDLIPVSIICFVLLLGFSLLFVQEKRPGSTEIGSFILLDGQCSDSKKFLIVQLQYHGDTLEFVTKGDFQWFLNGKNIGSVSSISFTKGNGTELKSGDTLQLELKSEEKFRSGDMVKLTFRNGFQLLFSI
jgi:hypothetical protein